MGENLTVTVEEYIPGILKLSKSIDMKVIFPHLLQALQLIAINHLVKWRQFASGEPIPGCPKPISSRGDYARSINGDFSSDYIKSVYSTGTFTDKIEKGHGEIDLKPGLLAGKKARMGKNGAYNIVPFRHGIPNSLKSNNPMPTSVYQDMLKNTNAIDKAGGVGTSRITGKGATVVRRASGAIDPARSYAWGYRLPASKSAPPESTQVWFAWMQVRKKHALANILLSE